MPTLRSTFVSPVLLALLVCAPLALLLPDVRHGLESRMALHMLVEFPLLMCAGWAVHHLFSSWGVTKAALEKLALIDHRGLTGATFVTCVTIVWMIPSALDAALLSDEVALVKYASWLISGFVLAGSWRRMDAEMALFFLGNVGWMMATAGLLYVEAPNRLCVSYLEGDQKHAGVGLMLLAVLLVLAAAQRAMGGRNAERREADIAR